ncbi:hypothetical protein QCA50_000606 [Cerrena zonata]|uniref:Uncharacterized protein n=1 Tax=Cerrena zonata TaxID=2478898 RepID=A0AAW0GZC1_9APHY
MADSTVLIFTLRQTLTIYRARREPYTSSTVATVLVRNGSVQFILLVIVNFANMLRDLSTTTLASLFVYINAVTTSILISRFILDLRSVYLKPQFTFSSNKPASSVNFASWVGNIGASLDVSWTAGQEGEVKEDDTLFSDTPLAVGLFDADGR